MDNCNMNKGCDGSVDVPGNGLDAVVAETAAEEVWYAYLCPITKREYYHNPCNGGTTTWVHPMTLQSGDGNDGNDGNQGNDEQVENFAREQLVRRIEATPRSSGAGAANNISIATNKKGSIPGIISQSIVSLSSSPSRSSSMSSVRTMSTSNVSSADIAIVNSVDEVAASQQKANNANKIDEINTHRQELIIDAATSECQEKDHFFAARDAFSEGDSHDLGADEDDYDDKDQHKEQLGGNYRRNDRNDANKTHCSQRLPIEKRRNDSSRNNQQCQITPSTPHNIPHTPENQQAPVTTQDTHHTRDTKNEQRTNDKIRFMPIVTPPPKHSNLHPSHHLPVPSPVTNTFSTPTNPATMHSPITNHDLLHTRSLLPGQIQPMQQDQNSYHDPRLHHQHHPQQLQRRQKKRRGGGWKLFLLLFVLAAMFLMFVVINITSASNKKSNSFSRNQTRVFADKDVVIHNRTTDVLVDKIDSIISWNVDNGDKNANMDSTAVLHQDNVKQQYHQQDQYHQHQNKQHQNKQQKKQHEQRKGNYKQQNEQKKDNENCQSGLLFANEYSIDNLAADTIQPKQSLQMTSKSQTSKSPTLPTALSKKYLPRICYIPFVYLVARRLCGHRPYSKKKTQLDVEKFVHEMLE